MRQPVRENKGRGSRKEQDRRLEQELLPQGLEQRGEVSLSEPRRLKEGLGSAATPALRRGPAHSRGVPLRGMSRMPGRGQQLKTWPAARALVEQSCNVRAVPSPPPPF